MQPDILFYEEIYHDLKAPITLIHAYINLLEREKGLTPEAINYLGEIKKNSYRMAKMLRDANDGARIINGMLLPYFINGDVVSMVKNLIEDARVLSAAKNTRMHFHSQIPSKVMAVDRLFIERILLNVLANAIRHSPPLGTITVRVRERTGHVYITVRDYGRGISPGFDVFALYSRGKLRGTHSGLGLYIVRELAFLLGGKVNIYSAKPGTEVVISLPVFLAENHEEENGTDDFFEDNMIQMELSVSC
jgi:signal transduction histidine kinase